MRIIVRYPNRRLYDQTKRSYTTLKEVHELVRKQVVFECFIARTGENITHRVLLSVLLECGSDLISTLELEELLRRDDSPVEVVRARQA